MLTLFVLAGVLLAAEPAAPLAGQPLLTMTFDQAGALPDGWTATGGRWTIADGRLRVDEVNGLAQLLLPVAPVADVAIEADVTFESARNAARWLALTGRVNDQSATLFTNRFNRSANNGLEIARGLGVVPGFQWQVLRTASAAIEGETGVSHHLRLELRGNTARAFLDQELVFNQRLPEVASGRVGILVSDVSATLDNLRVEALEPLPAPTPAELRDLRVVPLVVAHRGNSRYAPENTLAAFREAYEVGADVIEVDVNQTSDGVLIALHDTTFQRTAGDPRKPSEVTLAEVRQFDAGSWKDAKYAGEKIPTIAEVLDLVAETGGGVIFDLKATGLTDELAVLVAERGLEDRVLLGPWQLEEAADARRNFPTSTIMLIGSAPADVDHAWFANLRANGVTGFNTNAGSITPAFMRGAAIRGMAVFAWTVNDPARMLELRDLGVTGIVTDVPALCLETVIGP